MDLDTEPFFPQSKGQRNESVSFSRQNVIALLNNQWPPPLTTLIKASLKALNCMLSINPLISHTVAVVFIELLEFHQA